MLYVFLPLDCEAFIKGHLSWSSYFLYVLRIVNSHILSTNSFNIILLSKKTGYLIAKFKESHSLQLQVERVLSIC